MLGDYASDSDSGEEDSQVISSSSKNRVSQNIVASVQVNGGKEVVQKDYSESEVYCPFFPTSQQDSNDSGNIIKEKLEILNEKFKVLEGKSNVNQELVEQEKIRFETRLSDWKEGGINDEFFIKRLESHERMLNLRFLDKIVDHDLTKKRKSDNDMNNSDPPKKKSPTVIESKPVLYRKDETNNFDPMIFVHPDRMKYVLSGATKVNSNIEQNKKKDTKETISASYSSRVDKLIDKWNNLRNEEERMENEKNSLEGIEREREREIQKWLSTQLSTGTTDSNPNFVPLGKLK